MNPATTPIRPKRPKRPTAPARRRFIPPQHGAWAMLATPYIAGLIVAGYRWPDVPLAVAWLSAYLFSYFLFQALKSRRLGRYRTQLILYGIPALVMTSVVVAARPAVLWYAPAYAILVAANAWYAIRRRERALANDLAAVVQSCLIVPVVATIAGTPPAAVLPAFLLCLAYFGGTVFSVKTMIRERGNRAYWWLSVGYHAVALGVAAWISPWAAGLFAWLLIRSAVLPFTGWTPKRVGLIEFANCLALLACVALL